MGLGAFTKAARQILTIKAPSPNDDLLMLGMTGHERLGRLPSYELDMVANVDMLGSVQDIDLHKLIGQRVTVSMELDGPLMSQKRHFNGFIVRAERGERHGRFVRYSATMRPWPYFMMHRKNSRVFPEGSTVKDILTKVLGEYSSDYDMRLVFPLYPKMDYCVQYDETDFDFVSRLMERFGIYYFFEHTDSGHKMVLVDMVITHKPKKSPMPVMWATSLKQGQSVMNWHAYEEVRAQKVVMSDYDYLSSSTLVKGDKALTSPPAKLGKMEWFQHPSLVAENGASDTARMLMTEPADAAKLLLEERNSLAAAYRGVTNQRDMAVGETFVLANTPRGADKGLYLMVEARYVFAFADHEAVEDLKAIERRREGFRCEFTCINPLTGTFRPERITPVPRIHGPLTAVVVGGSSDEITTDKHGRIKIQFHWDREGKKDKDSSCWVRVAQPWAGKGYGMFALPRIGHEVVVSFIDGNPDRPLVTGSVYNDANTIAYELPKNATVTGLRSRSSKSGGTTDFNELRFDDSKGNEYVWFQAQKDYFRYVKNDAFDQVDKNETIRVKLTRKEVIGKDYLGDIKENSKTHIGKDCHLTVDGDSIEYVKGARDIKIDKTLKLVVEQDIGIEGKAKTEITSTGALNITGKDKVNIKGTPNLVLEGASKLSMKAPDVVGEGVSSIKLKAPQVVIEGMSSLVLKVGGSLVSISPGGVDIVGPMVKINSGGSGGSADSGETATEAAAVSPAEAQKEASLTESSYDDNFKDPITK